MASFQGFWFPAHTSFPTLQVDEVSMVRMQRMLLLHCKVSRVRRLHRFWRTWRGNNLCASLVHWLLASTSEMQLVQPSILQRPHKFPRILTGIVCMWSMWIWWIHDKWYHVDKNRKKKGKKSYWVWLLGC